MTVPVGRVRVAEGLALPCVDIGSRDGRSVVLLHAYADSWRSFEGVLGFLPASIRTVVPTQRGHGDAPKPAAGYAVGDFAEDLASLLDALEIESATPWSLRERVESLGVLEVIAGLQDPVDAEFVREFVVATSSERVPNAFIDLMAAESSKVPAHVWKGTLEGLLEAAPPEAGAIRAPTLVLWGDRDGIVPREDQERLCAALPRSRLVVYEGAGHAVLWEQPERVARDITAVVAELLA